MDIPQPGIWGEPSILLCGRPDRGRGMGMEASQGRLSGQGNIEALTQQTMTSCICLQPTCSVCSFLLLHFYSYQTTSSIYHHASSRSRNQLQPGGCVRMDPETGGQENQRIYQRCKCTATDTAEYALNILTGPFLDIFQKGSP